MGKKGKKGHKMATWRKYARAIVGGLGVVTGGIVALSPSFRGLEMLKTGDVYGAARTISYDTSGVDPGNPSSQPDVGKMARTGVVALVGVGLMFLFRKVARKI